MTVTRLLGFLAIDASIWVAQMTSLPNLLHSAIIGFWAINTISKFSISCRPWKSWCYHLPWWFRSGSWFLADSWSWRRSRCPCLPYDSVYSPSPWHSVLVSGELVMIKSVICFQLLWRLRFGLTANSLWLNLPVLCPFLRWAGGWPRARVHHYRAEHLEDILEVYVLNQLDVINSL